MHIAIKKLMLLTGFVVGMSVAGTGEAIVYYQPVRTPIVVTCNECSYSNSVSFNSWFSPFNLCGAFLYTMTPNIAIEKYWNTFEECPKCGRKNWKVETDFKSWWKDSLLDYTVIN